MSQGSPSSQKLMLVSQKQTMGLELKSVEEF